MTSKPWVFRETLAYRLEGSVNAMTHKNDEVGETVVVLCAANLVRSPLAASMLRERLSQVGRTDIQVVSSGVEATPGVTSPGEILRVALDMGLDLSAHVSRSVSSQEIASAALILTMTETQRAAVERRVPGTVARSFTLAELCRLLRDDEHVCDGVTELARRAHRLRPVAYPPTRSEDVDDPIGGPLSHYRRTARQLELLLDEISRHICPDESKRPQAHIS